jgi:hypothetical protein
MLAPGSPTNPEYGIEASRIAAFRLPTLLSHALVAFTNEFDNEAEHRMPHRTTSHGPTGIAPLSLAGVTRDVVELHAVRWRKRSDRPARCIAWLERRRT